MSDITFADEIEAQCGERALAHLRMCEALLHQLSHQAELVKIECPQLARFRDDMIDAVDATIHDTSLAWQIRRLTQALNGPHPLRGQSRKATTEVFRLFISHDKAMR